MKHHACLMLLATMFSVPSFAELTQSGPDGASIRHEFQIGAAPAEAWQALLHPEKWWPDDHTWSGSSAHLSLNATAGGCFCERWDGGSAEHARVIMAQPVRMLRMRGSLGPLQEMAVTGVLTIKLAPTESGSHAIVTYRISGDSSHALEGFMPVVDKVIGQQFAAWQKFSSTE